VTRTKLLDFGEDPNLDLRFFFVILHDWEIEPKTTYSGISQVVDRFRRNLVGRSGM